MPSIGYILPSYQVFPYARACLESLFASTPDYDVTAYVVDDASPDWDEKWFDDLPGEVKLTRFRKHGGLTRSWNYGLRWVKKDGMDYAICGNNDVLLPPEWHYGLIEASQAGYAPVGPLSNAPGVTAKGQQHVGGYIPSFELSDDMDYLANVSRSLRQAYAGHVVPSKVNGFFMFAATDTWWRNRIDGDHVFYPLVRRLPSGKPNRQDPKMTAQEDDLQYRWKQRGVYPAIAVSSFVWHYRSVSRGKKFVRDGWYRSSELEA